MTRVSLCSALIGWLLLVGSQAVFAWETVHQPPEAFLEEYAPGCQQKALWLSKDVKSRVEQLMDRPWSGVRVRYCLADGRTAWILDEIGKTEPITTGVVVNDGRVERVRVLVFRESRGGEVHREAFVRQYDGATLEPDGGLDRPIDGITGATLSLWALNRQVKLALYLDEVARQSSPGDFQ